MYCAIWPGLKCQELQHYNYQCVLRSLFDWFTPLWAGMFFFASRCSIGPCPSPAAWLKRRWAWCLSTGRSWLLATPNYWSKQQMNNRMMHNSLGKRRLIVVMNEKTTGEAEEAACCPRNKINFHSAVQWWLFLALALKPTYIFHLALVLFCTQYV